jgi:dynein light intermediate chain 1
VWRTRIHSLSMDEPPSRAPTPPADLWGAILEAVSSSRAIPAKQILLLGEPGTGKSALAAALLQKPPPPAADDGARLDFALHYDWADVRDDADEGVYRMWGAGYMRALTCG